MVHLLTFILTFVTFLAVSAVPGSAGTTARVPSTTEGSASMTPLMLGDGGLAQYWWIIAIVLLAALAFWYVLRRNSRSA